MTTNGSSTYGQLTEKMVVIKTLCQFYCSPADLWTVVDKKTHIESFLNLGCYVGAEWKESWQKSLIPPQNIKGVKVIFMESEREREDAYLE